MSYHVSIDKVAVVSAGHLSDGPHATSATVLEYICLFTHDLKRKQKRWQDGRLKYHMFNKRIMVYDDRGNYVGDMHWRKDWDFDEGEEVQLERGGALVQVLEYVGRQNQDLSDLLDKRAQEKERRQAKVASRSAGTATPAPQPQIPAGRFQLRHRPLNQLIATPARQLGRAHIPTESPFEQRQKMAKDGSPNEPRPTKKPRYDETPTSKMGYAQSLFGARLTLSGFASSAPTRHVIRERREPDRENPSSSQSSSNGKHKEAPEQDSIHLPKSVEINRSLQRTTNLPVRKHISVTMAEDDVVDLTSQAATTEEPAKPPKSKRKVQEEEVKDKPAVPRSLETSSKRQRLLLFEEEMSVPDEAPQDKEDSIAPVRERQRTKLRLKSRQRRGLLLVSEQSKIDDAVQLEQEYQLSHLAQKRPTPEPDAEDESFMPSPASKMVDSQSGYQTPIPDNLETIVALSSPAPEQVESPTRNCVAIPDDLKDNRFASSPISKQSDPPVRDPTPVSDDLEDPFAAPSALDKEDSPVRSVGIESHRTDQSASNDDDVVLTRTRAKVHRPRREAGGNCSQNVSIYDISSDTEDDKARIRELRGDLDADPSEHEPVKSTSKGNTNKKRQPKRRKQAKSVANSVESDDDVIESRPSKKRRKRRATLRDDSDPEMSAGPRFVKIKSSAKSLELIHAPPEYLKKFRRPAVRLGGGLSLPHGSAVEVFTSPEAVPDAEPKQPENTPVIHDLNGGTATDLVIHRQTVTNKQKAKQPSREQPPHVETQAEFHDENEDASSVQESKMQSSLRAVADCNNAAGRVNTQRAHHVKHCGILAAQQTNVQPSTLAVEKEYNNVARGRDFTTVNSITSAAAKPQRYAENDSIRQKPHSPPRQTMRNTAEVVQSNDGVAKSAITRNQQRNSKPKARIHKEDVPAVPPVLLGEPGAGGLLVPNISLRGTDIHTITTTITTSVTTPSEPHPQSPAVNGRPRIANPATRGRKAGLKSDAAGQARQHFLPGGVDSRPPERGNAFPRPGGPAVSGGGNTDAPTMNERPKRKMRFPGFQPVSAGGPWSEEAYDLLGTERPI